MNKLDDKVVIRKSHLAALCGMLNPLNQNQDRVANEAVRLLDQNFTGWAAVPVKPSRAMIQAGMDGYNSKVFGSDGIAAAYPAMLEASPPLPGGGE